MIQFYFYSFFGVKGQWNKIQPNDPQHIHRGFHDNYITFFIKGVNGYVNVIQPHVSDMTYYCRTGERFLESNVVVGGKCTEAHAKMILEYIQGRKWQSRIKKAYSARNRWVDGKPV